MDVSKKTIHEAVAYPGRDKPKYLGAFDTLKDPSVGLSSSSGEVVSFCYEAGPGGFQLYLKIRSMGHECDVVAPNLVPRSSADRVKTDRRDSLKLTRAHRDGALPAVWVPDESHEAIILLKTKVNAIDTNATDLAVELENGNEKTTEKFDMILAAVGRVPNGDSINAKAAQVAVDERNFIQVDAQQRTNVDGIYAIRNITGNPMLAHRATHQGKVAAEVTAGVKSGFDTSIIPSVAYTDPEFAWVGLTEKEAKRTGVSVQKAVFPWRASGRALSMARSEGVTKLLFDPESNRLVGAGIAGPNAGELIGEVALAIEMGADAQDIALTVHAHPTLSETINFATEVYEGTVTDIYLPKK